MKISRKTVLLIGVFAFVLLMPFVSAAQDELDDFALPPPPDASDEMMPPPPGDDMGTDSDMPPLEDAGEELGEDAPPPPDEGDDTEDAPPPPDEEGEELAPPPAEEAGAEEPPPPDDEEMAPPPMDDEEEPVKVTKKTAKKSSGASGYAVKGGDSLWRISGKSSIYGDAFKWPLLFKSNRDIIEDPDLIYPRQKLDVKTNYSESEIDDAVGKAKETPPFEPHSVPRKKLPIRY